MVFIFIPLEVLIVTIIYLVLAAVATQIDGGAMVANVANQNAEGIIIFFVILNLIIVSVIVFWGCRIYSRKKNRIIEVTNVLSLSYKTTIVAIYGFLWGTFMCVPALADGGTFGLIEQFFNFLGSLIIPLVGLIILFLMWLPVIAIEEIITLIKENVFLNIFLRIISCVICTYIAKRWLFNQVIPWCLEESGPALIENIYGSQIFDTLEKMHFL